MPSSLFSSLSTRWACATMNQAGERTFPEGTVIVKEKWAQDAQFKLDTSAHEPAGLGIMWSNAPPVSTRRSAIGNISMSTKHALSPAINPNSKTAAPVTVPSATQIPSFILLSCD